MPAAPLHGRSAFPCSLAVQPPPLPPLLPRRYCAPSQLRAGATSKSTCAGRCPRGVLKGSIRDGALGRRVHREYLVSCRPQGFPGSFAYAATKWALRGMTKSAAIDFGGRKIRVNSIHPGPIDTDMIAFRTPEQREERMKQAPMHRYGTPEEVAQLVAFLLSDESSHITVAEIAIDGASSA